jgi:hypothetical protein
MVHTKKKEMQIPVVHGLIDRRILANFHIDPAVMAEALPPPFRPKLANGYAIGGICLIRLKSIRPRFLPLPWGISSENAAHRIAVEWDVDGQVQEGVYIPRRDTNLWINTLAGGTLFPGIHNRATFTVGETDDTYVVTLRSDDGDTRVHVAGRLSDQLAPSSIFSSITEASAFFERGSLGYSATQTDDCFDGLELRCRDWQVTPLAIDQIESSYFMDESRFPSGSVAFDCALLMRDIQHEWHGRENLCYLESAGEAPRPPASAPHSGKNQSLH